MMCQDYLRKFVDLSVARVMCLSAVIGQALFAQSDGIPGTTNSARSFDIAVISVQNVVQIHCHFKRVFIDADPPREFIDSREHAAERLTDKAGNPLLNRPFIVSTQHSAFPDPLSQLVERMLCDQLDQDRDGLITHSELAELSVRLSGADIDEDETFEQLEIATDLLQQTLGSRSRPQSPELSSLTVIVVDTSAGQQTMDDELIKVGVSPEQQAVAVHVHVTIQMDAAGKAMFHPDHRNVSGDTEFLTLPGGLVIFHDGHVLEFWADHGLSGHSDASRRSGRLAHGVQLQSSELAGTAMRPDAVSIPSRSGRRGLFEWLDRNRDGRLQSSLDLLDLGPTDVGRWKKSKFDLALAAWM